MLLGAALFAVSRFVKPSTEKTPPSRQIFLTVDDLRQLQIGFAAQWQRAPTQEEMLGLLENRIKEEILYREALAMGLDKDDTIVKRRMAQKMEFLAEDVAAAHEPTTEELKAWFAKNRQCSRSRRASRSATSTSRRTIAAPTRRRTPRRRYRSSPGRPRAGRARRRWATHS